MIQDKIKLKNYTVQNRLVIQPMEGADGTSEGGIGELTYRRYMRFAESGAGIIWFEAVAVCNEGRANPRQLFLNEGNVAEYKKVVSDLKEKSRNLFGFEPLVIVQLTHSGRQSRPVNLPEPLVGFRNEYLERGKENLEYKIASDEYCDSVPEMYKKATRLAMQAGFDGVDIKCCHGYLFAEMLGAYEREGKYGGSFENRSRLFLDCISGAKSVLGEDKILTARLNATDCYPYPNGFGIDADGNIDLSECKKLLKILESKGVEIVNITLGNPYIIPHINRPCLGAPEKMSVGRERVRAIMRELSAHTDLKLIMSALTSAGEKSIEYCEEVLAEGICDFVGFGRMAFAYPTFYQDYLNKGSIDKNKCCIMCGKCTQLMRSGTVAGCPIRDIEAYLPLYKKYVLIQEA